MLNRVILMGRLTRDPELRSTQSGISVASFTLAVDRGFKGAENEPQVDFINIVAWREKAEFVSKWFRKGQLVAVSGRIQVRNWTDKDDNKRTSVEVVAEDCYFAETKRDSSAGPVLTAPMPTEPTGSEFEELLGEDSDLPF